MIDVKIRARPAAPIDPLAGADAGGELRLVVEWVEIDGGGIMTVPVDETNWLAQVFGQRDVEAARAVVAARVQQDLTLAASVAELAPVQRRKLQLAAQGDFQRFLDDCRALRAEHGSSELAGPLVLDLQLVIGLQQRFISGLPGEGTLYQKLLTACLTEPQRRALDQARQDVERLKSTGRVWSGVIALPDPPVDLR